jgi:hypothetical protein
MRLFGRKIPKTIFYSEKMNLSQMIDKSMNLAENIPKIIGINVFDENHNYFNLLFVILLLDIVSYLGISFYDIYLFREDLVRVTFCIVTLGMVSYEY